MAILDHRGNPVDTARLSEELSAPNVRSVRQVFHDSVASGLTPDRLGSILRAVRDGDAAEYLTLAEEFEEKDPHYSAVLRTRKLAVTGLNVAVDAASDDPKDIELADLVRGIVKAGAFRQLMADQMDALGKGYSVSEIMWNKGGKLWRPREYKHRDPRHFVFDRDTGRELRLVDDKDLVNGLPLEPYKFVVHTPQLKTGLPIRGGLALLVAAPFIFKAYGIKDWMVFAEVFGMPIRLGKYDDHATPQQMTDLLRAVTNIGSDAAATIPKSMEIDFVAAVSSAGGDKLFQGMAEFFDRQVSKAVLGQTSSSDAQSTGLGSGVADSHGEVRHDIRDDDAMKLAATLHRDVIKPFIDLNFGPREEHEYPTLRIFKPQQEDLKGLAEALTPFIDRGLKVGASVIRDKFNIEEPAKDEELLKPQGGASPFASAAPAPTAAGGDNLASVRRSTTVALMNRMLAGETLTADQRRFVELAARGEPDTIDELTDEALDDWEKVVNPMTEPIMQLARNAKSLEELKKDLASAQLDTSELVNVIASMTFKARGLGDATDKK